MVLKDMVEKLVAPYVDLPLECDGMTRVVSYLLTADGIPHDVYLGGITVPGKGTFAPHFWIVLRNEDIVDFRSRMWFDNDPTIPQGVFTPDETKVLYSGEKVQMRADKILFRVLTGNFE